MTRRTLSVVAVTATAVLAVAPLASAHVSIHPNVLPAGANATLQLRVPNERDDAATDRIDVLLPDGFIGVDVQPLPGWTVVQRTRKLATPVKTDDGTVTSEVSELSFRGNDRKGEGQIPVGGFQDFALAVQVPDVAGQALSFKTVQRYDDGKTVRWIGSLSSESPAPTVNVTAAGGTLLDVAGDEAGPKPGQTGASGTAAAPAAATRIVEKRGGSTVAVIALIVGVLALGVGATAIVRSRRGGARA